MCQLKVWTYVYADGRQYPRQQRTLCGQPNCSTQIIQMNPEYQSRPPPIAPMAPGTASIIIPNAPRKKDKRPPELKLEWNLFGGSSKQEKSSKSKPLKPLTTPVQTSYPVQIPIAAGNPRYGVGVQIAPASPPITPTRVMIEPQYRTITPPHRELQPVREHRYPSNLRRSNSERVVVVQQREHRPRQRSTSRNRREADLEEQRRTARRRREEEIAAIEARIRALNDELENNRNLRTSAVRIGQQGATIRDFDTEIARLRAELESQQRRQRAAQGPIIHQAGGRDVRAAPGPEIREHHQPGFRSRHQDAGGGLAGAGGPSGHRGRDREREIDRELRRLRRLVDLSSTRTERLPASGEQIGWGGVNFGRRARSRDGVRVERRRAET